MTKKLDDLEEQTFYEDDSSEIPPSDIVAYNELRSCADLVRMHKDGILVIQPEFQREVVWKGPDQTRFIDSLVKQLPIPSMCFSLDYKTSKWYVIDGLQRMSTIIRFLAGSDWTLSKLDDIDPKIAGKNITKFIDKSSDLRAYYTRIENLTLPITVLRCDYSNKRHTNYLFTIFHRLNTGGMKLNNQEIRNCIYSGPFNDLLKELNKNDLWMKLNRMKRATGYRFTKEETILRFFAFQEKYKTYNGRLASFLNEYMDDNRNLKPAEWQAKAALFNRSVQIISEKIFSGNPQKLGVTIIEALLTGVSFNLDFLDKQSNDKVAAMYQKLLAHPEFSEEQMVEGLAHRARVIGRIDAAKTIFSH